MDLSNKTNRIIMFCITYFLGMFGVHWFIQKDYKKGIIYLFTCGGFVFMWLIDIVKSFINIFNYNPDYMAVKEKNKKESQINYIQDNTVHYSKATIELKIREMQLKASDFNRILKDVQYGFKNLDPYLSRFKILMEIYTEMEEINNKYSLSLLPYTSETLYQTFNEGLSKFLKNKIIVILDKHSIDDDNKFLIKDLKKVRNDIIEGKHQYPEFSDLLQEIQFQLETEIKKL